MSSNITNFPNGITSFGIPVIGNGQIPITVPSNYVKYYFVDGKYGSDSYNGITPDTAFATIAKAITTVNARIDWAASPWATRDVIVIAPGKYQENLTSLPYGAMMIGLGEVNDQDGELSVKIEPVSGAPVDVTAWINCHIEGIRFRSCDTSDCFQVDIANNVCIQRCAFQGANGASPTTTKGFHLVQSAVHCHILDCDFDLVKNGVYINYHAGGDVFNTSRVQGCRIHGADQTGVYAHVNQVCTQSYIDSNLIGGGCTLAIGVDDNSNTLFISRNIIYATDGIEGGLTTGGNYCNGSLE